MGNLPSSPRAPAGRLDVNRELLERVGGAWIEAGATFFGIWLDGDLLAGWPGDVIPDCEPLRATARIGSASLELRLYGLDRPGDQPRLAADARQLAQVASLENELNSMTQELIDSQDQLLALYDLTEATRTSLEIREVLFALAREGARLIKAPAACAILISEHPVEIVHYPAPILTQPLLMLLFGELQDMGHRLLIHHSDDGHRLPEDVDSLLVEPVRIRGEIRAALVFFNKSGGFNSPDLKLVHAIADQASVQIENAQMYQDKLIQARMQTELELAKNVQLRLLPQKLPQVNGLDIFAGSLPALQVGGDFYDYIYQPGEPFTFTVGDVTGKGMPAALLMTMTRTVIRTKVRSLAEPSPANILGSSNDDMYDDFSEVSMFATVFVGQYERRDRVLYYANAGHSPVIYCPAGGTATLLEADSPPLGVLPLSTCENQSLSLYPGDVLVVATDGFSEESNPSGELFGYERLLRLVEALAHEPAQRIATSMFEALADFSGGTPQHDDQTLFVVKGV